MGVCEKMVHFYSIHIDHNIGSFNYGHFFEGVRHFLESFLEGFQHFLGVSQKCN